ncbi:MAG: hypothetical protein JNL30_12525 [Rubrivivax sp.]|nr:hypothetical protein [Rubrivivax sp.]
MTRRGPLTAAPALRELTASRGAPPDAALCTRRLACLEVLRHSSLPLASLVLQLHELLCFLRAYPGDARVRAAAESLLSGFAQRRDLQRHRRALADSGVAGTDIHYRFFAGQAQWLAQRWPQQLHLDRSDAQADARIAGALPQLLSAAEADALIELKPASGYTLLDRLRGAHTDAAFLLARIDALAAPSLVRETLSDAIDASYVLRAGTGTPSRTHAFFAAAPCSRTFARLPPRGRPELRGELARAPRAVRRLSARMGAELADLAQAAMVTRARSLEAFSYAEPRDAWLVDDGEGLSFGLVGMRPERRHVLTSSHGGLTLRNGVPIGYTQADICGRTAALSFNTFDTFRGSEAAHTFARWLAALHHLFGTTSFTIDPYQLGVGNKEGLASGAWWFYFKLGFRPRDTEVAREAQAELARLARQPGSRTAPRTLLRLARAHLFFDRDPARPVPLPQTAALGLAAGAALGQRGGSRERALQACAHELLELCGLERWKGFKAQEREAWLRLAPVASLLGVPDWPLEDRRSLAQVLRSKGWRSEREHVALAIAHPRFAPALLAAGRRAESATPFGAPTGRSWPPPRP